MNEKPQEFKIFCPNCGQHLSFDSTMFDQVFQCPTCGKEVKTPSMPDPEPAPVVVDVVRRGDGGEKRKRFLRDVGIISAVVVVRILVFLGNRLSQEKTSVSSSPPPAAEQKISKSDGSPAPSQNTKSSAPLTSSYDRNQNKLTESEKMAMGRVFYVFGKVEGWKSVLASLGDTEGETAALQFVAALGGMGVLTEVSTDGCPEDFAKAWKAFAASTALLQTIESGYNLMVAAVQNALNNGQYVDRDALQKIAEVEEELPECRATWKKTLDAFAVVCQKYGLDNLKRWSLEAYQRYEGNPDAKLFNSDK